VVAGFSASGTFLMVAAMAASAPAQHAAPVSLGHLDQPAERIERRLEIGGLLRYDDDPVIAAVLGHRHAETIDNAATRRRQQPQVDAVLLGKNRVPVLLQYLQLVHPPGKSGGQQRLAAGEQSGTAR